MFENKTYKTVNLPNADILAWLKTHTLRNSTGSDIYHLLECRRKKSFDPLTVFKARACGYCPPLMEWEDCSHRYKLNHFHIEALVLFSFTQYCSCLCSVFPLNKRKIGKQSHHVDYFKYGMIGHVYRFVWVRFWRLKKKEQKVCVMCRDRHSFQFWLAKLVLGRVCVFAIKCSTGEETAKIVHPDSRFI